MSDGSVLLYFPDCERFLADTAIEIVEIKKTEEELSREPDYGFKLWLARRVCEKRGWIFSTFVADKISSKVTCSPTRGASA